MKKPSQSAGQLMELINHAIQDCEVTPKEYNEIMEMAQADSHLDAEEKALLAQFQEMISNGAIKRVRG